MNIDWSLLVTKAMKEEIQAKAIIDEVSAKISEGRALADKMIAPLQDAIDLDDATPEDVINLKKWKTYRVALSRTTSQPGYPTEVDWPVTPE